jgi:hypothetical protein
MRSPKTTARPICLWLPRLLPGVGVCFDFVGASERFTYENSPQEAYTGRAWTGVGSVRGVLVGFSPAGCTSIRIATTLRYE